MDFASSGGNPNDFCQRTDPCLDLGLAQLRVGLRTPTASGKHCTVRAEPYGAKQVEHSGARCSLLMSPR